MAATTVRGGQSGRRTATSPATPGSRAAPRPPARDQDGDRHRRRHPLRPRPGEDHGHQRPGLRRRSRRVPRGVPRDQQINSYAIPELNREAGSRQERQDRHGVRRDVHVRGLHHVAAKRPRQGGLWHDRPRRGHASNACTSSTAWAPCSASTSVITARGTRLSMRSSPGCTASTRSSARTSDDSDISRIGRGELAVEDAAADVAEVLDLCASGRDGDRRATSPRRSGPGTRPDRPREGMGDRGRPAVVAGARQPQPRRQRRRRHPDSPAKPARTAVERRHQRPARPRPGS